MSRDYDTLERAIAQLLRLNASRKVHDRFAAAAGVALSQPVAVLLRRIAEHGPLSLSEAAALTHMDPAATGRQIKELEREGLVVRGPSSDDRRVTVVRVTPKGAEASSRFIDVWQRHMQDALRGWSNSDRATLARLLTRLVDDLRAHRYRDLGEDVAL